VACHRRLLPLPPLRRFVDPIVPDEGLVVTENRRQQDPVAVFGNPDHGWVLKLASSREIVSQGSLRAVKPSYRGASRAISSSVPGLTWTKPDAGSSIQTRIPQVAQKLQIFVRFPSSAGGSSGSFRH
jgi:hypothetical protein